MLKPLKNKVIVTLEEQNKTESGLVLTSTLDTDSVLATIVAIPNKCNKESSECDEIKVGDKIILSKFSGNKIKYNKKEYLVVDIDNVLAIVEEE